MIVNINKWESSLWVSPVCLVSPAMKRQHYLVTELLPPSPSLFTEDLLFLLAFVTFLKTLHTIYDLIHASLGHLFVFCLKSKHFYGLLDEFRPGLSLKTTAFSASDDYLLCWSYYICNLKQHTHIYTEWDIERQRDKETQRQRKWYSLGMFYISAFFFWAHDKH